MSVIPLVSRGLRPEFRTDDPVVLDMNEWRKLVRHIRLKASLIARVDSEIRSRLYESTCERSLG